MILAGDVGGTKTLLGLFEAAPSRPQPVIVRTFATLDFHDLSTMIRALLEGEAHRSTAIDAACFGVAGLVVGQTAVLTNVPWRIDARVVGHAANIPVVHLLNDLEAMAYGVTVLDDSETHVLQEGERDPAGNVAVVAPGTGLGEALLHNVHGSLIPSATEGGHADFAARTEREITLLRDLTARFGRAEVEHVLSGRGLVNIHRALQSSACSARVDFDDPDAPAAISKAALAGHCACCADTLDLFVDALGAEAGNLALRSVARGGVFVGGGIAPQILSALTRGGFVRAFRAKTPFEDMLSRVPVKVILNRDAALLGAAVFGGRAT